MALNPSRSARASTLYHLVTLAASVSAAILVSACTGDGGSGSASSSTSGGGGGSSGPGGDGGSAAGYCGDGVLNAGEQCDDGNAADDDGCAPTCTSKVVMTTTSFEATTDDFANPERGFYSQVDLEGGAEEAVDIKMSGLTLAYAPAHLDAYRDKPIDDAFLTSLGAGLAGVRAAGIKVILRFVYNDGFDPDAPKDRVLEHIGQIKPLLEENADVIAAMQAGFIGAWGEWHSSTNGLDTPAAMKDILVALLKSLPASRAAQIRTPMYKDAIFPGGPLADADAFSGSDKARTGHHNDCFLASDSDMGTYDDPIDQWKAYVGSEGRFVPVGGETCAVNKPRTDCATALKELSDLHFSFLNSLYHPNVLSGWDNGGCMPEIQRRLGYRFSLESASWSERVAPGGALGIVVSMRNDGFAAMFNHRTVYAVLGEGKDRRVAALSAADPRRWEPGGVTTFKAWLRVPSDVMPGSYRLALWLPDDADAIKDRPDYAVRLANSGVWDDTTGENVLTSSLSVDPGAQGSTVPGSNDFAEIK